MSVRSCVPALCLIFAAGLCETVSAATDSDTQAQRPTATAVRIAKPELTAARIRARRLVIESHLTPPMREWLAIIANSQRSALLDAPGSAVQSIGAQIRAQRPNLSEQQVGLLTFYVASSVVSPKDTLGEMTSQLQLKLQLAMERQEKLLELLSNMMKKSSDTDAAIIQNMK